MENKEDTTTVVRDVYPDKILQDFGRDFKKVIKGESRIENWQIAVAIGSGVIYPTFPFVIGIFYVLYRALSSNKFELEEGKHYTSSKMKEVEGDEDRP